MGSETAVFDADPTKFLRAIQQIEAGQQRLRRSLGQTAKAALDGSQQAAQGYITQQKALAALTAKKKEHEVSLGRLIHGQQALGRSMGQTNQIIGQLSYAVDDFLTVVGTSGLAGGLRAAGNNLSVVLAGFNPMLAILPAIGTAVATFATKSYESSNALKEEAKALKDAQDHLENHKKLIEDLDQAYRRSTQSSEEFSKQEAKAASEKGLADEAEIQRGLSAEMEGAKGTAKSLEGEIAAYSAGDLSDPFTAQKLTDLTAKRKQAWLEQERIFREIEASKKRVKGIQEGEKRRQLGASVEPLVGQALKDAEDMIEEDYKSAPDTFKTEINIARNKVKAAQDRAEDLRTRAEDKASPGGHRTTRAEKDAIDEAKKQTEALSRILEALERQERDRPVNLERDRIPVDRAGAA